MSAFRKLVKQFLVIASGNAFVQKALNANIKVAQYLVGISSGSPAESSGEDVVFDILKEKFASPYHIFDVGANRGQFLRLALDNLKDRAAEIYCFEPSATAFEMLSEFACGEPRVKLNNIAIGNRSGTDTLYYARHASPTASFTKRNLDHLGVEFSLSEQVTTKSIDDYCSEENIGHIDLLKMDIEGHELDALNGASGMLKAGAIDMIMFEFGGCNVDTRTYFRDFWNLLSPLDMKLFRITPSKYLQPIRSYEEIHEHFLNTNYLAIQKKFG